MDLIREDLTERRLRFKSRVGRVAGGSLTDIVVFPSASAGLSRQFHTAVTAVMAARYRPLTLSHTVTSTPTLSSRPYLCIHVSCFWRNWEDWGTGRPVCSWRPCFGFVDSLKNLS
ncbi:uncharacterized protein LOC122266747 [Penaeus japonicus]|uniref:uncharacterized protein LOC122266747 n=1 Tax=Penaeus japonicus TaxID=27405 RepID=UPI001C7160A8|nr:uncharacterized protein LOC122266747 [Penaeus japonicus]